MSQAAAGAIRDPQWVEARFAANQGRVNASNIKVDIDTRRRNRAKYFQEKAVGRFRDGSWVFIDGDVVIVAATESEMWGQTPDILSPNFYHVQVGQEAAFDQPTEFRI